MSEELEWVDLARLVDEAEDFILRREASWSLDSFTKNVMEDVIMELRFLSIFFGYFGLWSLAPSAAPPSSRPSSPMSHLDGDEMDSLLIEVSAIGEELDRFFQHPLFDRFSEDPQQKLIAKLVNLGRSVRHPFRSKRSKLLRVLIPLRDSIASVQSRARYVYQGFSLSRLSFHLQPNWSETEVDYDWKLFRFLLEKNLTCFKYQSSEIDSLFKTLRRILDSLDWLLTTSRSNSGNTNNYPRWPPWKENVMAHQFIDMCERIGNLHHEMDPPTPEFLDIILGSFGLYDDQERFVFSFVDYICGVQDDFELLRNEFMSLFICLIKIPKMHQQDMLQNVHKILVDGIKDVVMEAKPLKSKGRRASKTHFAITLAKIWSLKAKIFIESNGAFLEFSMYKYNHVKDLREGCQFLEKVFRDMGEEESLMLKIIEGVPDHVESLCHSFPDEEYIYLVHVKVGIFISKSVLHMILIRSNALLLDLLEEDASFRVPLNHTFATLRSVLLFLIDLLESMIKVNIEDEKPILEDIEIAARTVNSIFTIFLVHDNLTVTEERVEDVDTQLLDLLEKVQHLKVKLRGFYYIPNYPVPKIPGLCFIEFLSRNLRDLLNCNHDSIAYATHHIVAICTNLDFIMPTIKDVLTQGTGKQEDIVSRFVNVAYEIEHAVSSMLRENKQGWQSFSWLELEIENEHGWQNFLWLDDLLEEVQHIKTQLAESDWNSTCGEGGNDFPPEIMHVLSQVVTTTIDEVMVGLNDQKDETVDRLTRGTQQRDVVSIVGMPGIGKTTLAKNVFCNQTIMLHFHVRAWSYISPKYKKRDLLLDILRHMIAITDETNAMCDEDIEELLYKQLKGKRYLVVMDDMWSKGAWDDLRPSFPDDSNGSRMLITSRLSNVVSEISDPHPLRPLSPEESWELLKLKIFQEKECPHELLEVGKQIARNCKGLPLAIGAIAGLLHRTCGESKDMWNRIADSVSSRVVNDPETQCKKILELSYNHLPDHLKACLLYFGAFPKDKDIPVWRLQWLWIAEGFVHKLECKSSEDLAEDYLMDLIGRSLVMVAKRKSNGKVKACRVHDVMRDLCIVRAKEDNFLQSVSADDEPYSSFNGLSCDLPLELFITSNERTYMDYRLSFYVNRKHFVVSRPSGPSVRSLLFFATPDQYPRCPYNVSFIPTNYRRLRVLDLESINMGEYLEFGMEHLVDLRYLAVCGDIDSIPSSLSNLEHLESLIVKSLKSNVKLPETIWNMQKLRHLCISKCATFDWGWTEDEIPTMGSLPSLVSLSLLCFTCWEVIDGLKMRFPNLQKLRCIVLKPRDIYEGFSSFPAFESQCKLESLNISYYGKVLNAGELKFPSSIKKLTLSNFRLPWSHISVIGRLHHLEVLKLVSEAFEGSSWTMEEGEFLNLKYLKLDTLNIVHWEAISEHLPRLQQLIVRKCEQLEEIPFDFVSISTLVKIEVQQCGISLEESVRRIEEEEIEGLKIFINNSYSST